MLDPGRIEKRLAPAKQPGERRAVRSDGGLAAGCPIKHGQRTIRRMTGPTPAPTDAGHPATAPTWTPGSWRRLPAAQQPDWPDPAALDQVLGEVAKLPPLVFAGEVRALQAALATVADGRGFLLQAGDCAESFDAFSANSIRDKLRVILQMAVVLTYGAGVPVVKLGRIAGQFAKPRSSPTELVDGAELPAFRGDMVNGLDRTPAARTPDPLRILRAYHQSSATLNLLRAFTKGGFADLNQVHTWNQEFVAQSSAGRRYEASADAIDRALHFMAACGVDLSDSSPIHQVDFYTSHEALLLGFEQAMTRQDSLTGGWYDCSAHLLWVGDRTRQLDGAHLEFLAGVGNPVAVKLGPTATPAETVAVCERLDPHRVPGRLTLVARLGASRVEELLPPLVRAVRRSGHPVVWACDPMHGNTFVGTSGHKTRRFDDVMAELRAFFAVHRAEGSHPGGIHVELTGEDVTECLGGAEDILDGQLNLRYETACDPRLNAGQAIELAFQVAELLRG
jgi:3-deoxy-7-phosphoheptulonate synthase